MTDDLERIIRPIVEGQIRSFLKEHPKLVEAVDWYKPRKDKGTTFTNSLSKRIVRDLCCAKTKCRLVAALSGMLNGTEKLLNSSVEYCSADEAATLGNITERSGFKKTPMGFPGWFPTAVLFSMIIFPLLVKIFQ